jgi:TfoX/Sxy family transcriptional regulator of competence genes
MFGEFAVYCDGKVVALVCDNQFFLKPTAAGRALLDRVREAPPYPGAKPYYLVDAQLDDADAVAAIVRATAAALPLPKAKTAAANRSRAAKPKPRPPSKSKPTRQ